MRFDPFRGFREAAQYLQAECFSRWIHARSIGSYPGTHSVQQWLDNPTPLNRLRDWLGGEFPEEASGEGAPPHSWLCRCLGGLRRTAGSRYDIRAAEELRNLILREPEMLSRDGYEATREVGAEVLRMAWSFEGQRGVLARVLYDLMSPEELAREWEDLARALASREIECWVPYSTRGPYSVIEHPHLERFTLLTRAVIANQVDETYRRTWCRFLDDPLDSRFAHPSFPAVLEMPTDDQSVGKPNDDAIKEAFRIMVFSNSEFGRTEEIVLGLRVRKTVERFPYREDWDKWFQRTAAESQWPEWAVKALRAVDIYASTRRCRLFDTAWGLGTG